jgi:DNA-binding PadR family transcriptional regulator
MSSPSTLGYALLGLVAREALSGYDLAQRLDMPVGFFWSARHSQIYPELSKLARAGLLKHKTVRQSDRPDKKVYTLTPKGRVALAAWVASPFEAPARRDELMLRVYSMWLVAPQEAAALLRAEERVHAARLAEYERHRADVERHWADDLRDVTSPRFATYATLRRGLGYEAEYVAWCRWLADKLEG